MKSHPNQRIIQVIKDNVATDYFKISNSNLIKAMYNLKANTFKLYIYLADNANGRKFPLYACDFERVSGVSYDTYIRSFNELVYNGYLVRIDEKSNIYKFYEKSIIDDELVNPKQDLIQTLDKSLFDYDYEEARKKLLADREKQNQNT